MKFYPEIELQIFSLLLLAFQKPLVLAEFYVHRFKWRSDTMPVAKICFNYKMKIIF